MRILDESPLCFQGRGPKTEPSPKHNSTLSLYAEIRYCSTDAAEAELGSVSLYIVPLCIGAILEFLRSGNAVWSLLQKTAFQFENARKSRMQLETVR